MLKASMTGPGPLSDFPAVDLPPETQPLSVERLDSLVVDLTAELLSRGGSFPLRVVWARKPL
jgi:hypothetical protein